MWDSRISAADSAKADQPADTWTAETAIAGEGKGYKRSDTEQMRRGLLGGRVRRGDRGGHDLFYYRGYYTAKGKGKDVLKNFVKQNGPPPSKGGEAFHRRKEEVEAW